MKIGIIGAGNIGATLARKFSASGHEVKLANSRGPDSIRDLANEVGASAVTREDAVKDVEVIILAIPFEKYRSLANLFNHVPESVVVVDTSNYYPFRDNAIAEVDNGKPESLWASEQIGRSLIKAWNALLVQTLTDGGREPGSPERIAAPIAGDDAEAKRIVADLVSTTGFDSVDAGKLDESWRFQPGSPAYCTELTVDELKTALASVDKARIAGNRDAIMQSVMDGKVEFVREAMVANNRKMSV